MKSRPGFTLVEIIVTIVVLLILVTISIFSVITIQQRGRDAEREANATVIAEALEKYYDENGEYPGCSAITATAEDVRSDTLSGISVSALLTPNAEETVDNAIRCSDLTASNINDDYFAYVGNSSPSCQTGSYCSSWTIKYIQETSDSIIQINSRRNFSGFTTSEPTGVAVTASHSGGIARGTAGGGLCTSDATIERQIRYSSTSTTTAGSWSSWTTTNQLEVPATEGWQYTFEQRARCNASGSTSNWVSSNQANTVPPITSAGAISISHTTTSTMINFVRTDSTCPTGASQRYQYKLFGDWGYETAWTAATMSPNFNWTSPNQGFEYTLHIQPACYTAYSEGPWGTAAEDSYIRPVDDPSGAPTSFSHTIASDRRSRVFAWTPPTCGPGAQAQHRWNSYIGPGTMTWSDTGANGWRFSPSTAYSPQGAWTPLMTINVGTGTVPTGVQVQHRVQYICVNTTTLRSSGWGPAGTSPTYTT